MGDGKQDINSRFKDRFTNIQTSKNAIDKQREFDAQKDRLSKEFATLDLDQDGKIALDELQAFLDSKVSLDLARQIVSDDREARSGSRKV